MFLTLLNFFFGSPGKVRIKNLSKKPVPVPVKYKKRRKITPAIWADAQKLLLEKDNDPEIRFADIAELLGISTTSLKLINRSNTYKGYKKARFAEAGKQFKGKESA